jgi:2-polyprenyl-6-methoxyphenol hydroxylase-like FAD-dependent oxidoreductase
MDAHTEISRVAIVGTGLIGSSWAACFLAHGLDVVLTDPAPGMEDNVREYVEAAWAALTKIGLAPGASTSRRDSNLISKKPLQTLTWCRKTPLNASPLRSNYSRKSIRSFPRLPYWRRVLLASL